MQGNMWVDSELGLGSAFFFTLTADIAQPTRQTTMEKLSPFDNRTILLVDTTEDKVPIQSELEDVGLRTFRVRGVSEVTKKDAFPHIDSIIVDSVAATEGIRQLEHMRYIPVVLLTQASPPLNRTYITMYIVFFFFF
jgi:osomolarity two-component system, sensor histidine kinase NIK1